MPVRSDSSKSVFYRRKARTCRSLAAWAQSGPDRDQLLSMGRIWLERAASEDWRDGLPPLPPVNSSALRLARPH